MSGRSVLGAIAVMLGLCGSVAFADCGCGPMETGYAPVEATYSAYYPAPVAYYAPTPGYRTYYAAPVRQPYTTYYAPAPPPTGVYYAPYGVAGRSIFGAPRVYMPWQPVRNVLRAVTP